MEFDLNFSPDSYFENLDLKQKSGSKILGEVRRSNAVKKKMRQTFLEPYPPELVGRPLNKYIRTMRSKMHPDFMGGEYLPNVDSNESEICRIVLSTTTMDVISVRANIENGVINYRVCDEDEEIFGYVLKHNASQKPLAMSLLVENIDTCVINEIHEDEDIYFGTGLVHHFLKSSVDDGLDREVVSNFVKVESAFYPKLNEYYENQQSIWIDNLFGNTP